MLVLEQDNLKEIIEENDLVFVQYGATWCGSCKIMKPKFKALATENNNASFYYVDAEEFPESRGLAQVNNLPTFAVFKNGNFIDQVQTNKAEVLKSFINETPNH